MSTQEATSRATVSRNAIERDDETIDTIGNLLYFYSGNTSAMLRYFDALRTTDPMQDFRDQSIDYHADTDHSHLCSDCGMDTRLGHKIWCGV